MNKKEPSIDIFIKSYPKDYTLLKYALLSIQKYLSGYRKVILLIPNQGFNPEIPEDLNIEIKFVREYGNGYLYQQWCKISASNHSDADYILFADSDCIFDKPTNVLDLVKNKPQILYTDYSKVGDAICWKEPTDKFMNEPQQYEFMRRLPLVYHTSTLRTINELEPNLESIIMNSDRFSEFNAMGAWAFRHESEKYNFINTDEWSYSEPISVQLWSHGKKNGNVLETTEYNKSIETINRVLELNINQI